MTFKNKKIDRLLKILEKIGWGVKILPDVNDDNYVLIRTNTPYYRAEVKKDEFLNHCAEEALDKMKRELLGEE